MNPLAVGGGNDALGAKNHTVGIVLDECLKGGGDLFCREFSRSFYAKALKDIIGVMMTVVVAAAVAMLVVIVVMMLVIVTAAVAMLVVIVMMMLVIVTAAVAMLVVVVVVMMLLLKSADGLDRKSVV